MAIYQTGAYRVKPESVAKVKAARAHMDRIREENRKLFGEQNSAVEFIRQGRDNA